MDTLRAVAYILNFVVLLGSLYPTTHAGGPAEEGVPWLGMAALAAVNVALLYH